MAKTTMTGMTGAEIESRFPPVPFEEWGEWTDLYTAEVGEVRETGARALCYDWCFPRTDTKSIGFSFDYDVLSVLLERGRKIVKGGPA